MKSLSEHYTIVRAISVDKAFQYFSDFENYKQRYPKYCADIQIAEASGDQLRTREIWNLSIGEIEHVTIEVLYTKKPPNEIGYEIIEGFGKGTRQSMYFDVKSENETVIRMNLPAFDIIKLLLPKAMDYSNMLLKSRNT